VVVWKGSDYWNLVSESFRASDSLEVEQILKVVPFPFAETLILQACNLTYWFCHPFLWDLFISVLLFFFCLRHYECRPALCKPRALAGVLVLRQGSADSSMDITASKFPRLSGQDIYLMFS